MSVAKVYKAEEDTEKNKVKAIISRFKAIFLPNINNFNKQTKKEEEMERLISELITDLIKRMATEKRKEKAASSGAAFLSHACDLLRLPFISFMSFMSK